MEQIKEIELVDVEKIRTDGGTQPRATIDRAVVEEFAKAMREGADFPPMVVFFDGKEHWLADGFHRHGAYVICKREKATCEIHKGDLAEAKRFAAGANQKHGLRRTNEDKARAVMLALEVMADKSDYEIAKHVGVGSTMVREYRHNYAPRVDTPTEKSSDKEPIEPPTQPARVVTRKGKTYPMKVGKIGSNNPKRRQPAYKGIAPGKHQFHPATAYASPVIVHIPRDAARAASMLVQTLPRPLIEAIWLELGKLLKENEHDNATEKSS